MKRVSASGFLHHKGHAYHLGEIFACCRVGLQRNPSGQTEIYFANRLLGYLVFDPAQRFRPPAYIAASDRKSLAKNKPKSISKV